MQSCERTEGRLRERRKATSEPNSLLTENLFKQQQEFIIPVIVKNSSGKTYFWLRLYYTILFSKLNVFDLFFVFFTHSVRLNDE